MEDDVIWNVDKTMNFLAHEYQAARIIHPNCPADKEKHRIRVHLKGSALSGQMSTYAGLLYATCKSKEEAKECLVELTKKLIRAGVIKEPTSESSNRFDHVELQEEHHE